MINNEVKIRVFGTSNCMYCKELCQGFSLIGVRYEFIDADADENQKMCDLLNVNKLPHAQCFTPSNNQVLYEFIGPIDAQVFMNKFSEKVSGKKNSVFKGSPSCKNCRKK